MTLADEIRDFVQKYYIQPAQKRGEKRITIRAGDIHREMGLADRMPAVCGAIGTRMFEKLCEVRLIERIGPTQGANVFFTFEIL